MRMGIARHRTLSVHWRIDCVSLVWRIVQYVMSVSRGLAKEMMLPILVVHTELHLWLKERKGELAEHGVVEISPADSSVSARATTDASRLAFPASDQTSTSINLILLFQSGSSSTPFLRFCILALRLGATGDSARNEKQGSYGARFHLPAHIFFGPCYPCIGTRAKFRRRSSSGL